MHGKVAFTMQTAGARRKVSSCIPCYTRKQKCNRQYPCNHCTRRRRPEDCAYYPPEGVHLAHPPAQVGTGHEESEHSRNLQQADSTSSVSNGLFADLKGIKTPTNSLRPSSLAEVFGYSEDSHTNTLALLQRGESYEEGNVSGKGQSLSNEIPVDAQQSLEKIPDRPILDFLVRYFVAEVNWIDQLVYVPWFLEQYQLWWAIKRPSSVFDLEFAVMILRMCSYASQFLPSQSCTIERIRGMTLADIRQACDDIADKVALTCTHLNPKGSLLRVQHLAFAGLKSRCEGQVNEFRHALSCAIQVALKIGIDRDPTEFSPDMHELEKEMRRRVFCNLYIWDSLLSRQLDRTAIFPFCLSRDNMPRMHLGPDIDDNKDLDEFTQHLLQARLANFWKSSHAECNSEYDVVAAEERYEKFCNEYLVTIPAAFALQPNTQWDEHLPILPKQRQMLHISIFESLCYNFRPALLQRSGQTRCLPKYKQVLLLSQRKALAVASLQALKGASSLHALMGGSQTRFTEIIRPTFEAAVLLVYLCKDRSLFDADRDRPSSSLNSDPLGAGIVNLTQEECTNAVRDALDRLQMLAEVSNMAEISAQALLQLLQKTIKQSGAAQPGAKAFFAANEGRPGADAASGDMDLSQYAGLNSVALPGTAIATFDYSGFDWEALASSL